MSNKSAKTPIPGVPEGGGNDKPAPSPTQYFSLRWNNHSMNLVTRFTGLYQSETLVDVTLAAEGKHLQAHKMILSACSDYFHSLFGATPNPYQHPIVILKDVTFEDLQVIVQFMYNGIVNVSSEKLPDILKTAETLQIKGLAEKFTESQGGGPRKTLISSSSFASTRHLSVPSPAQSRQASTESLPEYFHRTQASPRQASFESRQYSFESQSGMPGGSNSSTTKRQATNSPPLSPTRMQFRKKFRRMSGCGSSSERGNSVEDDRLHMHTITLRPGGREQSPPAIHLSPTRQSSSSTDASGVQNPANLNSGNSLSVARKKRELFSSARSSRSGGSNKSSEASIELHCSSSTKNPHQESSSSGERLGRSVSQQSFEIEPSLSQSTLSVPLKRHGSLNTTPTSLSNNQSSASPVPPTGTGGLLTPVPPGVGPPGVNNDPASTPTDLSINMDVRSPAGSVHSNSSSKSATSKRNRFLLKRQDCLSENKGFDNELDLTITPTTVHNSPLITSMSIPTSPNLRSPPMAHEHSSLDVPHPYATEPPVPFRHGPPLTVATSTFSMDSNAAEQMICESLAPPPPLAHRLPSVRVIPDAADPLSLEESANSMNYGLLHPNFRATPSMDSTTPPTSSANLPRPQRPTPPAPGALLPHDFGPYLGSNPPHSAPPPTTAPTPVTSQPTIYATPPSNATPCSVEQFGHCPKEREGPALGCNYCWNTTDVNGRILRRKTKYHCPDCQANLCIVPCFQAYHEALEKDKHANAANPPHGSGSGSHSSDHKT